jgi:hypothetical protein
VSEHDEREDYRDGPPVKSNMGLYLALFVASGLFLILLVFGCIASLALWRAAP